MIPMVHDDILDYAGRQAERADLRMMRSALVH
jgi:hypothetical protein